MLKDTEKPRLGLSLKGLLGFVKIIKNTKKSLSENVVNLPQQVEESYTHYITCWNKIRIQFTRIMSNLMTQKSQSSEVIDNILQNLTKYIELLNQKKFTSELIKLHISIIMDIFIYCPISCRVHLKDVFLMAEKISNDQLLNETVFEKQVAFMSKYYIFMGFLFSRLRRNYNFNIEKWMLEKSFFVKFLSDDENKDYTKTQLFFAEQINKAMLDMMNKTYEFLSYQQLSFKELSLYLNNHQSTNQQCSSGDFIDVHNLKTTQINLDNIKQMVEGFLMTQEYYRINADVLILSEQKKKDLSEDQKNQIKKKVSNIIDICFVKTSENGQYSVVICNTKSGKNNAVGNPVLLFFRGVVGMDLGIANGGLYQVQELVFSDVSQSKIADIDYSSMQINESEKCVNFLTSNGNAMVVKYLPIIQNLPNTNLNNVIILNQKKSDKTKEKEYIQDCEKRLNMFNFLYYESCLKRTQIIRNPKFKFKIGDIQRFDPSGDKLLIGTTSTDYLRSQEEAKEVDLDTPLVSQADVISRVQQSKLQTGEITGINIYQTFNILDLNHCKLLSKEHTFTGDSECVLSREMLTWKPEIKIPGKCTVDVRFTNDGKICAICTQDLGSENYRISFVSMLSSSIKGAVPLMGGFTPISLEFSRNSHYLKVVGIPLNDQNNRIVYFYDMKDKLKLVSNKGYKISAIDMKCHFVLPNGKVMVYGGQSGVLNFLDIKTQKLVTKNVGAPIKVISYDGESTHIQVLTTDSKIVTMN